MFALRERRLGMQQEVAQAGGDQLIIDRPQAFRTLGVRGPHVMQKAGGMRDECRGQGCLRKTIIDDATILFWTRGIV
jgi:hypothetical protein